MERKSSIVAGGYVLLVPPNRREILLSDTMTGTVGEPVPWFEHSRQAPLIVFASFDRKSITHVADGRKGVTAGTGLVRLNLADIQKLDKPISFRTLVKQAPNRIRSALANRLSKGGKLAPGSLGALVDIISRLSPNLRGRLARFSERRLQILRSLEPRARENLAFQKETVATALRIAGIERRTLLEWNPREDTAIHNYLEGLQQVTVREDIMISADHDAFPGFDLIRRIPHASTKIFEGDGVRLHVTMANRLPLEQQTGADLIYYNESFGSFVMVQYKAMEKESDGVSVFRLPNEQLDKEIMRMQDLLSELSKVQDDGKLLNYRLNADPFYLKFCSRIVLNMDDCGLFPGMYIPLGYWMRLVEDPCIQGKRGGRLVTFDNVGRKLNNTEFAALVGTGLIGTIIPQSNILKKLISEVLSSGKSMTLAIKFSAKPEETAAIADLPSP